LSAHVVLAAVVVDDVGEKAIDGDNMCKTDSEEIIAAAKRKGVQGETGDGIF